MLLAAGWVFGANDNSFIAWLIFGLYFVVAWLCGLTIRKAAAESESGARRAPSWAAVTPWLWTLLCPVLVVLGFNKQLDLHQPLLQWLKDLASQ